MLDDDELIITMLSRSLKHAGYETMVQTSAKNVVNNIAEWHPDLVLLDIHLDDGANGLDILAEIKKEKIDTQVVMLTGDDTAESAITAMKLGAADYLTKPFNVEEVKMVVKGLLEKTKLKDELDYLRKSRSASHLDRTWWGSLRSSNSIRDNAEKLAAAGAQTILITGESGTGKEVLARFIHDRVATQSFRLRRPSPVYHRQLHGPAGQPYRKRALRPYQVCLYRCENRQKGHVRTGQRRHHTARRNRRHAL